jgi:segregation and condensation protein B
MVTLTAIAYLQPVTRAALSRLAGKEISRDLIARLKRLDLIATGPRAPEPGAPYAYVTTRNFLSVFGLASLRDLPDLERLQDDGLMDAASPAGDLDRVLGLGDGLDLPEADAEEERAGASTTKPRNRPSHQRSA